MIRQLSSPDFKPFGELKVEFPALDDKPVDAAEVHLFAGTNGTGKTRVLSMLMAALNESAELSRRVAREGPDIRIDALHEFRPEGSNLRVYSCVYYLQPGSGRLKSSTVSPDFLAFAYSGAAYVADRPIQLLSEVSAPDRATRLRFTRHPDDSAGLMLTLARLKVQSAMEVLRDSPTPGEPDRARSLIRQVETAVSSVTGRPFSIRLDTYPLTKMEVQWGAQIMPFDALPDGLRGIIGWLVHVAVMLDLVNAGQKSIQETEVVLLLDEIEAHLHPTWQRKILPAIQKLLPKAQIFVATHSPFVIASLNHGWIYKFTADATGRVTIEPPRPASRGDSYVSVVEEIMDLKEWFDPESEAALEEFRGLREKALRGDPGAFEEAVKLGASIAERGPELAIVMGRELHQLRALAPASKPD